jgi:GNAT superfamily N-acetyltransferase
MVRFDARYAERLRLFDGTEAELRLVRPEDAPLLQAGFAALSPETRYLRFFAHKRVLTPAETTALTQLDDHDHLAVGAVGAPGSPARGMPMGVARYSRDPAGTVEAAVVVVDAFQGRGLGLALLQRLGAAAAERGVDALAFTTLATNRALVRLVQKAFPSVTTDAVEAGTLTLHARLEREPGPRGPERLEDGMV